MMCFGVLQHPDVVAFVGGHRQLPYLTPTLKQNKCLKQHQKLPYSAVIASHSHTCCFKKNKRNNIQQCIANTFAWVAPKCEVIQRLCLLRLAGPDGGVESQRENSA